MKVAILGSGNIGIDLLIKVLRSPYLECGVLIGRNSLSKGIQKVRELGINTSTSGIEYIQKNPDCCEIVFDATSAMAHTQHAPILKKMHKFTIDLTPAKIGEICVPIINLESSLHYKNVNMITCGGQATLPIIYALRILNAKIHYVEVVSSIASLSAGPATRINLDEYIHTTERAIKFFTGISNAKAILNLNPAFPCIDMQTTIFAKVDDLDRNKFTKTAAEIEKKVQSYVPGFKILLNSLIEDTCTVIVQVKGQGDYLPDYAGNLDIINCAALAIAERYAKTILHKEMLCDQS